MIFPQVLWNIMKDSDIGSVRWIVIIFSFQIISLEIMMQTLSKISYIQSPLK